MKSIISILSLFLGFFLEINAQTDVKFNIIGLAEKKIEILAEHHFKAKISLEISPEITFIDPIKTATINYWYRPRVGIGFGGRYYWRKPASTFRFYNGLIFKYNTQSMGTESRKIIRTERFIGLNTGAKVHLNKKLFLDISFAVAPSRIQRYKDANSNTFITYHPYISSGSPLFKLDFNLPDFDLPENMAFSSNLSICYRF
jgi:hypothetical protein